jgi:Bacterial PH domain
MLKILTLLMFTIILTGCASFGPLGTSGFESKILEDIQEMKSPIIYESPASFMHAIDGYNFAGVPLMLQYKPSKTGTYQSYVVGEGIIVLTEKKLFFVKWYKEKYQKYWDLDYENITDLEIRSFGLGRRLVLKFNQVPKVASFDIATDGGQRIDKKGAITVCQLIAQRVAKVCKLPN